VIVYDTGPLVAAALANDSDHKACVELFSTLHAARRELLVPATVVDRDQAITKTLGTFVRDARGPGKEPAEKAERGEQGG
jgi:predicted nucleic acid-binding protein